MSKSSIKVNVQLKGSTTYKVYTKLDIEVLNIAEEAGAWVADHR